MTELWKLSKAEWELEGHRARRIELDSAKKTEHTRNCKNMMSKNSAIQSR